MTVKIRMNPIAASDLKDIKHYIEQESIEIGVKIVKEIIERIETLSQFPEMGTMLKYKIELKTKYRYIICNQYIVFYLYEGDLVSIQRVLHGKRDYMSLLNEQ